MRGNRTEGGESNRAGLTFLLPLPFAMKLRPLLTTALAALAVLTTAVDAASSRWEAELAAFARADETRRPTPGGVVFVGSSSIRLWDGLEQAFDRFPTVVNRGFGGSTIAECAEHVDRLVSAHRPRTVVVYAGENDLAEGATAEQVASRVRAFVERVRAEQPAAHIAFVSIKPSPLRAELLPKVREANARIRAHLETVANAQFIDVHTAMLDPNGHPRAELFGPDRLHMSAAGYALWRREISARLP